MTLREREREREKERSERERECVCVCSVPAVLWSVHCSSTAAHTVYMYLQHRLLVHTADCSVHCAYTVCWSKVSHINFMD